MSDVLIKNMEKPRCCGDCKFCLGRAGGTIREIEMYCFLTGSTLCLYKNRETIEHIIHGNCPLVEVPKHGRLVEADKLQAKFFPDEDAYRIIENEPTVLEANNGCTD